ncbi:hypothetical protein AB0I69_33090 [Streptomyces sp. NPDC050508]|uniref:hypothetical protein n=1 Tax=Streptomyces sp. NPDC050508 TaxID=3155405 RepID=UPI00344A9BD0
MSVLPLRVTSDPLRLTLVLVAAVTVLSGVVQLVAPGLILGLLSADSTTTTRHLFATVGMFMAVVGGLLAHALVTAAPPPYLLQWAGAQKFCAFVLVGVGVARGLFGPSALLVAVFDLATAVLCWLMWRRLVHRGGAPRAAGAGV